MNDMSDMNDLQKKPVFSGLDNAIFKPVCIVSITKELKKGDFLFKQGDIADSCYIVKEGTIKLTKLTEDGEESVVHVINAGEILGESTLFRSISFHPVTAIALENVKVCYLSRNMLEQLVKKNPDLAWELIVNLSNQIYKNWEKILELNTQTTPEKVIGFFRQMAREYGEPCDKGTRIKIRLTQEEIASMVGASRVMVSKSLQKLITKQILLKEKKYYIIKES
ncbi:MAG: Crp/Fnr family transcriptional regulator [Firmicutes bacterium HGW-Firmicutes-12]|jgi:CRP/FNR family transcriptional regulator|nr:MAG: Crp/Fnr family transcriptional regulator [Firmicutes bacterium HGW-Firmicutes-12]